MFVLLFWILKSYFRWIIRYFFDFKRRLDVTFLRNVYQILCVYIYLYIIKTRFYSVLNKCCYSDFCIKKGPGSLLLSRLHTIVAVMMLNFRVRDGNGCVHHAIAARSSRDPSKPDTSSLLMITLSNLGQVLGLLVPPR